MRLRGQQASVRQPHSRSARSGQRRRAARCGALQPGSCMPPHAHAARCFIRLPDQSRPKIVMLPDSSDAEAFAAFRARCAAKLGIRLENPARLPPYFTKAGNNQHLNIFSVALTPPDMLEE